ncbi:ABC transporter ATP-binding protein [Rubrobacter taiwanensis]|jgi:iron(III) transport system ATP-binding protein|uniref:ABC-type quaternary amine transporter n=1 Tax=Rubrobacter taiwanensis TaxID=185139 RepID=A0A4R1BRP7_9ACTN|nr:ABC transporter ATP-binding protein [Rubrobacter taiwanensis]TCJ20463.1 ABC transporter ATP-binding protein [Rubrobacter taiwanensis]
MSETIVRLSGVSKRFGPVEAVRNLHLTLQKGRILALLGPSGCGKTTTLRLLAGFERPDSGEIEIAGRTVAGGGRHVPPEHRRVGMVFQDYALFPHLSVQQNIAYGLPRDGKRADRIREVLALAGLTGLEDRMPHELSGGQQQRVALARALAPEPAIILLDEPFSNLDAALRARVRAEVREIITAAGTTAIFVTHDREEALSLADEVAVMLDGELVQSAPPEELYTRPVNREVATLVGEANFLPAEARGGHARCELGEVPLLQDARGPVEIMLRPELLRLHPSENGSATVTGREFYGHDQLVRLRLDSGTVLACRLGFGPRFKPGDRVEISASGPAVAYG